MFSSGTNFAKLKTNLRLAINRLKLLEKKKTELAQKARKEIADFLAAGKTERAKIRVEHIIREDYLVEAMEVTEMYCDLLLARFGLVQQMKDLDEGLAEAISSLIWAAPRLQTDVAELKIISDQLTMKYGKQYAQACREQQVGTISERLIHKLSVQAPPKVLVEKYLVEIAKNYNVEYEPDPQVMREDEWASDPLINLVDDSKNNLGGGPGGAFGGGPGGAFGCGPVGSQQVGYFMQPGGTQPFAYPNSMSSYQGLMKPGCLPSILVTNPQSLTNCFDQFKTVVSEYNPDVVIVSETWFSPTRPAVRFPLDGYSLFHDDRPSRGGGAAVYARASLYPREAAVKIPTELECIWVELSAIATVVCGLYHPPRAPTAPLLMDQLANAVIDIRMHTDNEVIIVAGDFNDLRQERLNPSLNLHRLVTGPTHMNSVIDLILTDCPGGYHEPVLLPPIGLSHHQCVLAIPKSSVNVIKPTYLCA